MGKKYEVICSAVNGKQKIYGAGDIVDENDFIAGVAEGYVKTEHMKVCDKATTTKLQKLDSELSEKDEADLKSKLARIAEENEAKEGRKEKDRKKEVADKKISDKELKAKEAAEEEIEKANRS